MSKNRNLSQRINNNSNHRYFQHSATRSGDDVDESNKRQNEDADFHTAMIIHRTLRDTARRRCNIIVSGLPEESNCEEDRISFLGICEEWLPIKPLLSEGSCIRIGKQLQTGLPRRLLVRIGSEETANSLLKAAPLLRQAADVDVSERIFINPDLAPEAARLAYEQRKNRRAARATEQRQHTQLSNHTASRDFKSNSDMETIIDDSPSIKLATDQPIHLRYTSNLPTFQTATTLNVPSELNDNIITITAEVHNSEMNDILDEQPSNTSAAVSHTE